MKASNIELRAMTAADWEAVARIYKEGIETRLATFEIEVPTWEQWDGKHRPDCRIVAVKSSAVIGWVALMPVSSRYVYRGVAEHSVYIAAAARGQGVGMALMQALIDESEQQGIWMLQSATFPENKASLALHEKVGFRIIGYRERIGQLDGVWRDTVMFERRSNKVGC